jgi:large conductance mechanosensitive channel
MDPRKRAWSLVDEFKTFAFKGNVVDLAVGVIIGAAFGRIVDSLVKHLIMPFVGVFVPGEESFREWKFVLRGHDIPYGLFLSEVVNFLIIALVLFLFIRKFLAWAMRAREETRDAPPLSKDQELLSEIRDLLRAQSKKEAV